MGSEMCIRDSSCADSSYEPTPGYWESLLNATDKATVIHFTDQFPGDQMVMEDDRLPWYHGRGNLSFATNDTHVASTVMSWADGEHKYLPPESMTFEFDIEYEYEAH